MASDAPEKDSNSEWIVESIMVGNGETVVENNLEKELRKRVLYAAGRERASPGNYHEVAENSLVIFDNGLEATGCASYSVSPLFPKNPPPQPRNRSGNCVLNFQTRGGAAVPQRRSKCDTEVEAAKPGRYPQVLPAGLGS